MILKLLDRLFKRQFPIIDWQLVKESNKVYPESSFTLLKITTSSGRFGTGWVDKAYTRYEYKKFCPYHVLITVNLTDHIAENNPDIDMGTIEDYFSEPLKQICTFHMVSRVVTDEGMDIEGYLELDESAENFLTAKSQAEDRLVTFSYKINFDPNWKLSKLLR